MNEKVSIIVPVYNVEFYLEKCINSILKQTYKNVEIILVDDGSTDSCPAICDRYAMEYQQIQVIHKENGGLSSARNAGLDVSTGELIMFIDSDDFIEPKMVEKLYEVLKIYKADISICNFRYVDMLGNILDQYPEHIVQNECLNNMQYWEKVFDEYGYFYVVVWNKLYKRELWCKQKFPVGKINEDEYVLHYIIRLCNKIACRDYIGYNYVQRDGSIMDQKKKKANFDRFEAWLNRINYFKEIERSDFIKKEMIAYLDKLIYIYPKCHTADALKLFRVYCGKYKSLYNEFPLDEKELFRQKIKRIGCDKCPMAIYILMRIYSFLWIKVQKWKNWNNG